MMCKSPRAMKVSARKWDRSAANQHFDVVTADEPLSSYFTAATTQTTTADHCQEGGNNKNHSNLISTEQYIPSFHNVDIICGRSKLSHNNEGNKKFLAFIALYRKAYKDAPRRAQKSNMTIEIIDKINHEGGRFLRFDESSKSWQEADYEYKKEKVSHCLRATSTRRSDKLLNITSNKKNNENKKVQQANILMVDERKIQELLQLQREIMIEMLQTENANYRLFGEEEVTKPPSEINYLVG